MHELIDGLEAEYQLKRLEDGKLLISSLRTKIYRAKLAKDKKLYLTLCHVKAIYYFNRSNL